MPVDLRPLPPGLAGELLTLQRAAYVPEAQLHDDVWLPALVQTLPELVAELATSRCLGAWDGPRLVGAVRTRERDGVLHVARLVVAPDQQGRGIGTRLLAAAEAGTRLASATLFTGARSAANLRWYERCGYVESGREQLRPGVELVHLTKHLARTSIGDILVSARDAGEYRAMFDLSDGDLTGRVLDCPGGAASTTATLCAAGVDAVAVDPVYAVPPAELVARVDAELARGAAWNRATADRYAWGFYGDPAAHACRREASARVFAADLVAHPERYVAASLPDLPFPDGVFDLVLSSHLLFTYADRLDRGWHRAALREMVRVGRGSVRVFPLVDQAGWRLTGLVDHLVADLAAAGVTARLRPVPFEFQRGVREMLEVQVPPSR